MALPTLVLGNFDLTDWAGSNFGVSVIAEGTSKGAPVPIETAVKSWLQDGSIVATQGYDNRTVSLRVRLRGPDLVAVADAEAALHLELGKPNLLTWTPGDEFSPPSVFVVVTSSMEHAPSADEDIAEGIAFPWRTYNVRLLCEAHVRSDTEVVADALPATGTTTTLLDACSATTGWTGFVDGVSVSPATSGGAVTVSASVSAGGNHTHSLQKTFAATTTSTKLLIIDWKPPAGSLAPTGPIDGTRETLVATGDGVVLPLIAEGPSPTTGYTRTYFRVAATSLAVTRLDLRRYFPAGFTGSATFAADNVAVSDVNPIIGTGRQQLRSLSITGSARTQGSLAVESSTAALGDGTIVYVYPRDETTTGYTPSMRQFRYSGNTVTTNSALVSGASESLASLVIFNVPIGLFPAGEYVVMARLATSGGGTPTVSVQTLTAYPAFPIDAGIAFSRTITTTTAYQTFALGKVQLPTVDLDPASMAAGAVMYLGVVTTAPCTYDEIWLFNTTIGQMVQVDCGSGAGVVGGAARRLFIEPPTVTTPRPTLRIGHSADRSDSHYPVPLIGSGVNQIVGAWQFPQFVPPQVNVFTVTPNTTDSAVSLRYFPRWHTNAAS